MAVKKGDNAPDFTLQNTEGKEVKLSDFKGKNNVVLLFFPLAFTSVCTAELCTVRDDLSTFENLNAQVFGISIDSFFTLKEFKKASELNFPLLSDFNKTAAQDYGALYDEYFGMKGVTKRASFVVSREGTILFAEVLEDAQKQPDFNAIKQALEN